MAQNWKSLLRKWVTSSYFQAAVQLTVGTAVLSLFVFVDDLKFPASCNAAIIYAVITTALFPNSHMGGRILGAAVVLGCLLLGCAAGGATVAAAWAAKGGDTNLMEHVTNAMKSPPSPETARTLALIAETKAEMAMGAGNAMQGRTKPSLPELEAFARKVQIVGRPYYVVLSLMSAGMLLFVAVLRCDLDSPAGPMGSTVAVLAGLIIIAGGLAVPVIGMHGFWSKVVLNVVKLGLVAATAVVLSGTLVLPSLASEALLQNLAKTVKRVGEGVSRIQLDFKWEDRQEQAGKVSQEFLEPSESRAKFISEEELPGSVPSLKADKEDAAGLEEIRRITQPSQSSSTHSNRRHKLGRPPSLARLRQRLPLAQLQLLEARLEPPFLAPLPLFSGRWKAVIDALEVLISRASALEDYSSTPLRLTAILRHKLMIQEEVSRALHASQAGVAAGCASLAAALSNPRLIRRCPTAFPSPGDPDCNGWDDLQSKLAEAVEEIQDSFWNGLAKASAASPGRFTDWMALAELRWVVAVFSLCSSLLQAMEDLEVAVRHALGLRDSVPPDSAGVPQEALGQSTSKSGGSVTAMEAPSGLRDRSHAMGSSPPADLEAQSGMEPKLLQESSSNGEVGELGLDRDLNQTAEPKDEGAAKSRELHPWSEFFLLILACITSAPLLQRFGMVLWHFLRKLATPSKFRLDLASRSVLFGIKYWVASTTTIILLLYLLAKYPVQASNWQMATTFAVLCVCLQPLVEDTGYKTLLRLVFLVLAGLIGFGVMSSYRFATNPAAIMALLCLVSFIFGHMNGVLAIKYPMFFFMVTIYSMLLSQYTGHSQGTLQFFGGQVLATLIGSSLCLIFGVLLLPWYASQHALEQLADALTSCMSLSERMWDDFGKAAQEAAASGKDIQMPAAEYGQLLKTKVDKLLGQVGEACQDDTLPFDLPYVAERDLITPMPPVVKLTLAAVANLAARLWSAQLAAAQVPWKGKTDLLASIIPGLLSRPLARLYARQLDAAMRGYIAACSQLVQACRENLVAVHSYPLRASQETLQQRLRAAERAWLLLQDAMLATAPQALELVVNGGRQSHLENLVFHSWLLPYLRSLDQVLGVARTLLLEDCSNRNHYWSWLGCV